MSEVLFQRPLESSVISKLLIQEEQRAPTKGGWWPFRGGATKPPESLSRTSVGSPPHSPLRVRDTPKSPILLTGGSGVAGGFIGLPGADVARVPPLDADKYVGRGVVTS